MKGLAQNIFKLSQSLNIFEWMVLIIIVLMPVTTIRFLPMFYIGLTTFGMMAIFVLVALWDYRHTRYKKHKTKKAQHYRLVTALVFGGFVLTWLYLIG